VLDFGLAKVLEGKDETRSAVTAPGIWMGTLHYCAPEVLRGREADRRSDLYSFGIVLYQMACGRLPFEGLDGHALVSAILSGQARPAKNSNPLIGLALERSSWDSSPLILIGDRRARLILPELCARLSAARLPNRASRKQRRCSRC
jgi:serine/threonine protein kinase